MTCSLASLRAGRKGYERERAFPGATIIIPNGQRESGSHRLSTLCIRSPRSPGPRSRIKPRGLTDTPFPPFLPMKLALHFHPPPVDSASARVISLTDFPICARERHLSSVSIEFHPPACPHNSSRWSASRLALHTEGDANEVSAIRSCECTI